MVYKKDKRKKPVMV
jgi:hypothetical protein